MPKFKKNYILIAASLLLCVAVVLSLGIGANAEEKIVQQVKDTSLKCVQIHGMDADKPNAWENGPNCSYSENLDEKNYKLVTNAFNPWFTQDSVSFAYTEMSYVYGEEGRLVLETQLNSWTAAASVEACAGIMFRSSLNPGAMNVMMHCRPSRIMFTYRAADNSGSAKSRIITTTIRYPVKLKMELYEGYVSCFYQQAGDSDYVRVGDAPFSISGTVYAGFAAGTNAETEYATADYTGFNCYLAVPEGATPIDPSTSSGSSSTSSGPEPLDTEDPEVYDNVLLRETFSDGTLEAPENNDGIFETKDVEENGKVLKKQIVSNPVWTYNVKNKPNIVTNEQNTNRYLYDKRTANAYYFAGDQHWADYSMSLDFTFTEDYTEDMKNEFYVYVRNTDIDQYGVHNYAVAFRKKRINNKTVNCMSIARRAGGTYTATPIDVTSSVTSFVEGDVVDYEFDYLADENINVTHNLKITAFDNVITVYLDGTQCLRYTDVSTEVKGFGNIGFMSNNAAVKVDNIEVIKEEDLLGGDYDNKICGNWDMPIPDIIGYFKEKGYTY